MPAHSYTALYYPFIHFKDDGWLKLAALYWDRMARIVPGDYVTEDSPTVRQLGKFVEIVQPEDYSYLLRSAFENFIAQNRASLWMRYGVHLREGWPPIPPDERPPGAGGPSGTDPRLSYVFDQKINSDLVQTLKDSGLALPEPSNKRWLGMHPQLARVYTTALADEIAGKRGFFPTAATSLDQVAAGGRTMTRLAQALLDGVDLAAGEQEVESAAAYIAIQTAIPRDIGATPVEQILAFREKYPHERAAFQACMAQFADASQWMGTIDDPEAFNEAVTAEYRKKIKPKVDELREKLHEAHIDTVLGALGLQAAAPALATLGAQAAGVAANPALGLAAGLSLAVARVLRDRQKAQRELSASPVAYLLRVEKGLKPRTLIQEIAVAAHKFRFSGPHPPA